MTAPQKLRLHLAAWALYLALAAALTWPLAIRPRDYVVGEYMDAVTAFYDLWWFHQAVCVLHASPWQSPLIDYPDGYSMILYPMWVPYELPTLPIISALGVDGIPIAFNLVTLLSFAASGWAGFLLARYLTRDTGAALAAGVILEALPFRLWNINRWHVTCLELLALLLYFFLRVVREGKSRVIVGLAVTASVLAYLSPNYTADMALALALLLPILLIAPGRDRDRLRQRRTWVALASAAGLAILICLPLIHRLAMEVAKQPIPLAQSDVTRVPFSANLLAFVTPGFNLRALGWLAFLLPYPDQALARAHGIGGYELFAGYTALALAAAGIVWRRREAAPFVALALIFLVLSLGPRLHLGAHTFGFAAPYEWASGLLPWLRLDRSPARHAAVSLVCMAALAGYGLAELRRRLPRHAALLAFFAAAAIVLEFNQAPLPLARIPIPAFVETIRTDPVFGSVLDLPYLPDIKRFAGINQIHHGKPLAFQLTSRIDDPRYQSGALFRYLDHPRLWLRLQGKERQAALAQLRAEMKRRRLRYLVAYPRFMEPTDLAGLESVLSELGPRETIVKDDRYQVYRLTAFTH